MPISSPPPTLFVHFLSPQGKSGVERYGRVLQRENHSGSEISELEVSLSAPSAPPVEVEKASLVVFQYTPHHQPEQAIAYISACAARCNSTAKLVVFVHDANHVAECWENLFARRLWKKPRTLLRSLTGDVTKQGLFSLVRRDPRLRLVVFSENQRLRFPPPIRRSTLVLPHFVEPPVPNQGANVEKERLGLKGFTVLTVLGFIDPRKSPEFAIDCLAQLPSHYYLVLAGQPINSIPGYADALIMRATNQGVGQRVRITGYLSNEEQSAYIAASDYGLCLFKTASASGTLSTWAAHQIPMVAYPHPDFEVYAKISERAISLVRPGSIADFKRAVVDSSPQELAQAKEGLKQIAKSYDVPHLWQKLLDGLALLKS